MNKSFSIFISFFFALLVFGLGFELGILFHDHQQDAGRNSVPAIDCSAVISHLTSTMTTAILINGQVKSVNNSILTVTNGAEDFSFVVNVNTEVVYVAPELAVSNTMTRQPSKALADIRVGDSINIKARVLSNGDFEAESITILLSPYEQ